MTRNILGGLRVIEIGGGSVAAAVAGMSFADYGAEVVKLEPPEGDRLRDEHPSGFLVWNRGKSSRVVDLRTSAGQETARALIAGADVVLEAFRPGLASSWGLGPADVRAGNPGLVYCSIKGFGSSGPYAALPGHEGTVCAKVGFYSLGQWGYRPGPIFTSAPLASFGAGHLAFSGALAALTSREQSGRGQDLETTLLQGLVSTDYYGTMTWQHVHRLSGHAAVAGSSALASSRFGSRTSILAPTADGRWIIATGLLGHQARALSTALGLAGTIEDPRYVNQPYFSNPEDAQGWEDLMWEALRTRTYAEWEPILRASPDIAFELVRTSEEGLDHPQVVHDGYAIVVDDPQRGPIRQVGPMAKFSKTPAVVDKSAPALGEQRAPRPAAVSRAKTKIGAPDGLSPLAGTTIVELGYFYAMPYGVAMAAALGARVIKIEGRDGDPMRSAYGHPETGGAKTMEGKESLALDLSTEEGQKILRDVIAQADIVVDGFRPGTAERRGFGHEELMARDPHLTYIHASGYGSTGPFASRPIYAQVAAAIAGNLHRFAGQWLDPDFTTALNTMEAQEVILPRLRAPVDGDSNPALAVLSTIMLAVFDQRRMGEGQFVSTSMVGANALAYADDFCAYRGKPATPKPDAENTGLNALYRAYECETGWVFLVVARDSEFEALASEVGRQDLIGDRRFATSEDRAAHDDELATELEAEFKKHPASDWEARLTLRGVGCVEAFGASMSEFTCTDPVIRDAGLVVEVEHPYFGGILRPTAPVTFSDSSTRVAAGCMTGQHTEAILKELGYTAEHIDELITSGIAHSYTPLPSPYPESE